MKKYEPSLVAIEGDLAFSKKDVWIYAELPQLPYEFIEYNSREALAESLSIGLEGLLTSSEKSTECHLIVTSTPFDDEDWVTKLYQRSSRVDTSPAWNPLLERMHEHVYKQGFRSREVYLGVKVGARNEFANTGTFAALGDITGLLGKAFGAEDFAVSEKELEFWNKRASQIRNVFTVGALRAKPVRSETIARLLKETLWPGMRLETVSEIDREKWGKGEISGLAIADIHNGSKFLKISQFQNGKTIEGYKATLCFSRFPDEMHFPGQEPWIHSSSLLSSPTTIYSRFTIEPAGKVQKVVERKEKDALDQWRNSGGDNAPLAIIEQLQVAQELKYTLTRERKPWVFGRHRIVVNAPTQAKLEERVQEVIEHYKELNIEVVWPSGDQLNLLLESQPSDSVRSSAYYQRQELGIISIGMPSGSGKVGDEVEYRDGKAGGWLGPYLGRTTSRVEEPVFFSIHSAIAKNHPPGCVISGAPGGGKSFAGMTITYQMALQDVWTVFIDPKGDAIEMADLPGMKGRCKVINLKDGNAGILDPFTLDSNASQQRLLAIEVLKLFLGTKLDHRSETALLSAVELVSMSEVPSLYKVVEVLKVSDTDEGRSLGGRLNVIKDLPFSALCFAPSNSQELQNMNASDGLTIFNLKDLDLPSSPDKENYTTPNLLAVGIMYLLTRFTESLMFNSDQKHPKAVVIDEAWAITSTPQGKSMIPRLVRMGRSLNTAVIMISQNAGDFKDLANSMPYRLAFGTKSTEEIRAISDFLGLEKSENGEPLGGNVKTIFNLDRGECLMRDPSGRLARVKIDNWDQNQFEAFNTNPDTKKESSANLRK